MEKYLWHEKASVILTSATLTTHGEFDYLKLRLNGADASELMVGSPFDYETSTMLYLPQDIPEPTDNYGHQKTLEDTIVRLAKVSGGGCWSCSLPMPSCSAPPRTSKQRCRSLTFRS